MNKHLADENESLKNKLQDTKGIKSENASMQRNISELKYEIGELKSEIQLLRKEKEKKLHSNDAHAHELNICGSSDTSEWDTSDANNNISSSRIFKKKVKEHLKCQKKSISVRLLSIENAIKDIVSILKIMNTMMTEHKRERVEINSQKMDSHLDKLSMLQNLVKELVVVAQDTN